MAKQNVRDEIAADGREITLADGSVETIRYGFPALKVIEREYGSLGALQDEFEKGEKGAMFSNILFAIWAGTKRNKTVDAFGDLLDPKRIVEYTVAFGEAFKEGLGETAEDSVGEAEAGETPATN